MRVSKCTRSFLLSLMALMTTCDSVQQPKPKAQLRLEYPEPNYKQVPDVYRFDFEYNDLVQLKRIAKKAPDLYYPKMKATLYLSYVGVENNVDSLLNDAYQLPGKHMVKAEEIPERVFMAPEKRVYGTLFTVVGNAASQLQFFLTDSTDHFLMGSLYFYSRPNYDSIMPAAKYVERDVMHLMETFRWKD
ncbi:MAG: gliding motility lipoprotein GldD [Flavobacteriaceae bacterium]|jgi:gliding motility-associated lipoprotein GldD|nr:gliding motility lipoprotein GldD [Flavobacteriaceae bacterium]